MYEIGAVYIWQNQVDEYRVLNGSECTVLGPVEQWVLKHNGEEVEGQTTDTLWHGVNGNNMVAFAGDLHRKFPPTGELSIIELFKQREICHGN